MRDPEMDPAIDPAPPIPRAPLNLPICSSYSAFSSACFARCSAISPTGSVQIFITFRKKGFGFQVAAHVAASVSGWQRARIIGEHLMLRIQSCIRQTCVLGTENQQILTASQAGPNGNSQTKCTSCHLPNNAQCNTVGIATLRTIVITLQTTLTSTLHMYIPTCINNDLM